MTSLKIIYVVLFALVTGSCATSSLNNKQMAQISVAKGYADIAEATYRDSLLEAQALQAQIDSFLLRPSPESLQLTRDAWKKSRVPYQQSEVFRFSNAIVDAWEGRVNAWPLDEGLIDYVSASYGNGSADNSMYTTNIIANSNISVNGQTVDVTRINAELLSEEIHEIGGIEANVATGYHAIEFLLWGQDLNGTAAGAGNRPHTDFDVSRCTNGHCQRRREYLSVAGNLLITDLEWMLKQWGPSGLARQAVLDNSNDIEQHIFTGMGSLSYGELAGERIQLGLTLGDPEEEHDCFSDNTHNSHFYNIVGIQNVFLGRYLSSRGEFVADTSLQDLLRTTNPNLEASLTSAIERSLDVAAQIVQSAEVGGIAYDQMIAAGNDDGNRKVAALVTALREQTGWIQRAATKLGVATLDVQGSESLDNPEDVF